MGLRDLLYVWVLAPLAAAPVALLMEKVVPVAEADRAAGGLAALFGRPIGAVFAGFILQLLCGVAIYPYLVRRHWSGVASFALGAALPWALWWSLASGSVTRGLAGAACGAMLGVATWALLRFGR